MVGSGVDGHVTHALARSLSSYIQQFRHSHGHAPTMSKIRAHHSQLKRSENAPTEVLHSRWCHPGIQAAKRLGWKPLEGFFCSVCPQGKCTRHDINRDPVQRTQRIGALVSGDILDPFPASRTNKFRYCALFVSAHGKYVHTFPMVQKSEFVDAFKDLCLEYARAGHPIERFMTDSDSVMRSVAFRSVARANNCECRYSSPYNQWMNGGAERQVYTLKNKTICNLVQSRLGDEFWYSAMSHAAQSHNATPTATNPGGATPREVWHGRLTQQKSGRWHVAKENKLDESFRRAFGSDAWVRLDKSERTSIGPRSTRCIFVGYAPDHADGTWEFINTTTGRQRISRDAIFDERSVVPSTCHDWVVTEGKSSLPEWADTDPFTITDHVIGSQDAVRRTTPTPHKVSRTVSFAPYEEALGVPVTMQQVAQL